MKNIYSLFLFISIFSVNVKLQAQEDKDNKNRKLQQVTDLKFGIRGGFNSSSATGVDIETIDSFLGFHIGGFAQKPIQNDQLLLEIGALYSQKGFDKAILFGDDAAFTFQADTVGTSAAGSFTANFIDIPIIIKDNQYERFSPFAGLEMNILLNSEYNYSYTNADGEVIVGKETNLKDLKNFNMAAIVGLEYHFNHFFHVNFAYSYGLGSIDQGGDVKLKLNVIRICGGFSF